MPFDADVADLAIRQHGLVTADQVRALGGSASMVRRRVEAGRWLRVLHGVYQVRAVPFTWRTRVAACTLASGGVASHRTAAVLWELPGSRPGPPELTVPRGSRFTQGQARVHHSRAWDLRNETVIDGIPTTGPGRTIVDLAALVDRPRLDRLIDDLRRRRLLDWPDLLTAHLTHAACGRPGTARLAALLDERYGDAAVTESALEDLFIEVIRRAGLPEPHRQVALYDADGFVARVDMAYISSALAIEVDSLEFHLHQAFEADRAKRNRLELAGWRVLAYTSRRLRTEAAVVVGEVRQALERKVDPSTLRFALTQSPPV